MHLATLKWRAAAASPKPTPTSRRTSTISNAILFGPKGVGKTHFGRLLHKLYGVPFIDSDDLLEKPPRELVRTHGIAHFRALEKQAILSLHPQNTLIALGGGSVLDDEILAHVQTLGPLFYLKPKIVPPERIERYESIAATAILIHDKSETQILEELWQAITLEISFGSPHGANPTVAP